MTIKFANRVKVSTSTTGTGTITLGSAVNGFQTFSQGGILNGESIRYTIINGNEWEVGTGVYTHSGTTMSRSYEESSTGSLLNLAGDSEVFITVASTDIENIEDTANNALPKAGGTMTGAITFDASQTFDASDLTGTLPAIDGSNLTNVTAASVEVTESADDNVTYNILFSGTSGTGNVQMTPTQDDGGLTYNPSLDTLTTFKIQVADSIVHRDDTNTYIDFSSDEIRLVAGGVEFIRLVEGADDYVRFAQHIYLTTDQDIRFEGSTADDFETTLYVVDPTADRTILLPDATGTLALDDVATTSADGLMSSSDKTKLNGIEASADVTDTTNVTVAGALMDSEVTNLAQVKAFDSSDYATAAQGATADAALPKAGGALTGAVTTNSTFDGRDVATDGTKLDGIEANATADQTAAEIRTLVESATDSNVFTDADHTKLNGIEASADVTDTTNVTAAGALMDSEVTNLVQVKAFDSSDYATAAQGTTADNALPKAGGTMTGAITFAAGQAFDGRDVSADGTKLDGIESGATADQTDAEIRAAVEAATDSNVFTDADHTKLNAIEANATADQTAAEIRTLVEAATDSNVFTDADHTKLNGIEAGATADQTDAQIKTAYENNSDTNAFTDAEKTKLSGIETSADVTDTANVTAAGALMDSELTNVAAVKAINQGLTTTSDVTFNDVTVSGDLTVSGTTTTVNTETINLADNQILLNSNFTGATPTENGGIEIERGTQPNKTLIWDETNDRWTVGSETFIAGSFVGDGSNLTNVAAASIEVSESADDNVTYNILFSDTDGTGNVQMTPTQDDNGLTYNPSLDTLTTFKIQVADSIVHRDDTNTYIDFSSDEIRLVAGGVEFIRLVEGTDDYVRFGKHIYLTTGENIRFEGSTADNFETTLDVTDPTADRTITLPDATGTLALDDVATTSADGLMSSSDKTKLDGIEASADVTDTANVTSSGALMDSEVTNLAQVKAFDSSDYATAAQGTTADAALPKAGGTMTGNITFAASQTFDAGDLTGTLPAIDGSNLTNVAASTIEVVESSDTNAFYPLLFASNNGSGNVQKSVVQDKDGSFINLSFNPSTNTFVTNDAVLYGDLKFHGATIDSNLTTLTVTDPTANRTITLPNATGTVALDDVATTSAAGLMSSSDKTKLDGIEAGADVTDTANVTAAGALMDSEVTNLAQVKAFDSSDYATASHNHDDRYYTETEADSRFLRSDASDTMTGNLTVDNGTSTTLSVKCDDGGNALVRANGDSQGTGALEVGQSNSYGGGISYNGDNSPAFVSGESADNITFYRLENGTRTEVFHYPYNSNTVNFNGSITLGGTVDGRDVATDGTKLDGIEASADVTDTTNVTAAGALMDSELTDIASVKALNQGVATTDSPTFAAITIDGHTLQNSTNRSGLLQVDTDLGTWNGFSIASTGTSHWSIMGDQDDFGLYDDVNNEWIMLYNENSTLQLYSNGSNGLTVSSTGILLPINKYIQFEGSTNDSFETALTVADPTADRTITLPDADGTVWTSGNDGSGSGLDADLLDGQQGSYYLDYNNLTNTPAAGGSVALTAGIANFIGR